MRRWIGILALALLPAAAALAVPLSAQACRQLVAAQASDLRSADVNLGQYLQIKGWKSSPLRSAVCVGAPNPREALLALRAAHVQDGLLLNGLATPPRNPLELAVLEGVVAYLLDDSDAPVGEAGLDRRAAADEAGLMGRFQAEMRDPALLPAWQRPGWGQMPDPQRSGLAAWVGWRIVATWAARQEGRASALAWLREGVRADALLAASGYERDMAAAPDPRLLKLRAMVAELHRLWREGQLFSADDLVALSTQSPTECELDGPLADPGTACALVLPTPVQGVAATFVRSKPEKGRRYTSVTLDLIPLMNQPPRSDRLCVHARNLLQGLPEPAWARARVVLPHSLGQGRTLGYGPWEHALEVVEEAGCFRSARLFIQRPVTAAR